MYWSVSTYWSGMCWSSMCWGGMYWSGMYWSGKYWSAMYWSSLCWGSMYWSSSILSSQLVTLLFHCFPESPHLMLVALYVFPRRPPSAKPAIWVPIMHLNMSLLHQPPVFLFPPGRHLRVRKKEDRASWLRAFKSQYGSVAGFMA